MEPKLQPRAGVVPKPKVQLSLLYRLGCFIGIWFMKAAAGTIFFFKALKKPRSSPLNPTLVKSYPCRPTLETRIFFPPNYHPASEKQHLLPLYINIHGGGFAIANALVDDRFCASWAKRTGMLVISLNYRKAPLHPFPTATYDIAAVADAILSDPALPIDKSRVAIGGFSAGANLALSAAQLPPLKGVVKAAIAYYPVVDFGDDPSVKLALRPYDPKKAPGDKLERASWWLDWAYVNAGQDRRDVLLSPCFARKEDLPEWIYMVGAEWDMLRLEAQVMIHQLAGLEGREDQEEGFEEGTYKWTLAKGYSHGFTHGMPKDKGKREDLAKNLEEIYGGGHEWLKKSVLV